MLSAFWAKLLIRNFVLELFMLKCRVVLIFADLAPECNNDSGLLLRHGQKQVRLGSFE